MTCGTVGSIMTFVDIILLMAGIASRGCSLKNVIDMAVLTSYIDVLTIQLECCQVMVKGCGSPASGRVTDATIGPKAPLVVIVLGMAGITILGCGAKVSQVAGVKVAAAAKRVSMLAC
jgi:hypothetical protein